MRLTVRGNRHADVEAVAAMQRGLAAAGDPDVEVVFTDDFDAAVRAYLGSTTYSADRGTGTVGAKTLALDEGPVIVVNALVVVDQQPSMLERLLAHEAGHVLMNNRGEGLGGWRSLVDTQWRWTLLCVAGLAMEEVRAELAVGNAGLPPTDSSSADHLVYVLHSTSADLVDLLYTAGRDWGRIENEVIPQLDRLTKLLGYTAAETLRTGDDPDVASLGPLAEEAWLDYVAPTWQRRLEIYSALPPATEPITSEAWQKVLVAGADLEQQLLLDMGFAYEERPDGTYFFVRLGEQRLKARVARGLAQQKVYDADDGSAS